MTEQTSPHVLGTEKISKLLIKYSLPAIIAMTANSLYNMVDSIFIGHGVGALAIAGLATTFPLMNLGAAFGSLVGVGSSTLIAIKLGQKDKESATNILGNVVLLNLIIGTIYMTLMLVFLKPILLFFGASENTLPYAREYMTIILAGNLITHIYLGLNDVLRASGYPQKAMFATLMAVIVNCILDALFILVFEWGIKGAAFATIIAQIISLSFVLQHYFDEKSFLVFKKKAFRLRGQIISGILSIGMAPFLMNLCACLVVILINKQLFSYGGDFAVGAYGIVNRVAFFFLMIVMGFNQGMQPIAGYNYGAGQISRLICVFKYTVICGVGVTTFGFLISQLFPTAIVYLFTTEPELVDIGKKGLIIVFYAFPVVGFQMVSSNFFQSMGMAKKAIFLSLTRQLLFLIPLLLILPQFHGTLGIWVSIPIADAVSAVVAACMVFPLIRKLKNQANITSTN